MTHDLDLAPIGNSTISALIDRQGRYVWCCAPRVDSDPLFSNLLSGQEPDAAGARGFWSVDVAGAAHTRQAYLRNTPILRTEITDAAGAAVEIIDFAPRFRLYGRGYRPTSFIRLVRPLVGSPRLAIRLRPTVDWGAGDAAAASGSNHIRYAGKDVTLRLTTNLPVSHVLDERTFRLEEPVALFLGPDEPFQGEVLSTANGMLQDTAAYWREWVRTLARPPRLAGGGDPRRHHPEAVRLRGDRRDRRRPDHLDPRSAGQRAATGTTATAGSATPTTWSRPSTGWARSISWKTTWGICATSSTPPTAAISSRSMASALSRSSPSASSTTLPGYRGMGPVRVGNQAHEHVQHDVYGQIVLSNVQAFFDERLLRPATHEDFEVLERVGERAFALHDKPDAGLWELRTRSAVHTYSAAMCWAACDRLGNAAEKLGLVDRAKVWGDRARVVRAAIEEKAWNPDAGHFAATFGGEELDASLTQLVDLRFLEPDDPRNRDTLKAIEKHLRRGSNLLRYDQPDDFGAPETAFNFCTFWFIEGLHLIGETEEARRLFEEMLGRRNHAGLLSEDVSLTDGTLWGNYPQTYSLVGLINCAVLLSRPWSSVR